MSDYDIQLPDTDAYVGLQLLNGGSMTAEYHKLHAGELAIEFRMYDWSFLVHHGKTNRWVLWDLGMSSVCRPLLLSRLLLRSIGVHWIEPG